MVTGLVTSGVELSSETLYCREDRGTDISEEIPGRRRRQLLDDLKEMRGYWKLKEESLDRNAWITGFGTGPGPVIR